MLDIFCASRQFRVCVITNKLLYILSYNLVKLALENALFLHIMWDVCLVFH